MNNEHISTRFEDLAAADGTNPGSGASGTTTADGAMTALELLRQVRIGPMSRTEANQTLELLDRAHSMAAYLMCEVAHQVAVSEPDTDLAELLKQGARLTDRESKELAKITKYLWGTPKSPGTVLDR